MMLTCTSIEIEVKEIILIPLSRSDLPVQGVHFPLLITPMKFSIIIKEVKPIAQMRSTINHQFLDDWLIRASNKDSCHRDTLTQLYPVSGSSFGCESLEVRIRLQVNLTALIFTTTYYRE